MHSSFLSVCQWNGLFHLSRVLRKPDFCLGENKGVDQLRSHCRADQHFCFRYMDSTILLPSKSKISGLYPSSVTVHAGLCLTWSEILKPGFLVSWLILMSLLLMNVFSLKPLLLSDTSNPKIARDHNGLVDSTCMSVSHIRIACPYEPPREKTNNVVSEQV